METKEETNPPRHLYTIHQTTSSLIYRGVVESTAVASRVLSSLGIKVARGRVSELANGKRWSNKVIIVRHEVREEVLLTTDLLKILELAGTKEAERLLKNRNKTKHEK